MGEKGDIPKGPGDIDLEQGSHPDSGFTKKAEWEPPGLFLMVSTAIIMHKTGPFTNSGVSKFVKLVVVYTKHQQQV